MASSNTSKVTGHERVKPRRSHRKSRNGCRVCKSRHMKCDETRPACINCSVAGRTCEYQSSLVSSPKPSLPDTPEANSPAPILCTLRPSPAAISAVSPSHEHGPPVYKAAQLSALDSASLFTLEHFALYNHAKTVLNGTAMPHESPLHTVSVILEYALQGQYLMNQLLAFSALHLAHLHPERTDYPQHATDLQTRALSSFNEAKHDVSEATCIPMFLFSSLLGLHVLHDTLRYRPDNFGAFLEQYMSYMSLHRGVSIITGKSWAIIKISDLKTMIQKVEDTFNTAPDHAHETDVLYTMVNGSHMNDASIDAYHQAIKCVRNCLNFHHALTEQGTQAIDGPMTFCITVNKNYVEFLKQRQPEALVILAFYATMLHCSRDFWIFADGGQYIIQSITSHLGSHWERWLRWPNAVLRGESKI
ncbi:Sterol uptake control protein 2 [Ceratocystis fimbriata CBS 114723]|uniref:Sterol uptake control protein 2 n=1 Tax=Ceratocystis fimbriata CBS 114723 TaxID=1035309 RepID=A0A2C5X1V5_9PEZI|nr:Sterol uptake control protein 2 [Ceratocystis fimbriata CBS 114723]